MKLLKTWDRSSNAAVLLLPTEIVDMPEPSGVDKAQFHSLVNALVRDKGLQKNDAEMAARKFFSKPSRLMSNQKQDKQRRK